MTTVVSISQQSILLSAGLKFSVLVLPSALPLRTYSNTTFTLHTLTAPKTPGPHILKYSSYLCTSY
ncbi:hypothetical protein WALSEDRAFT_60877 [Wallemia mellicola CBS 633.66]|uniref:Uncharacterized protein n=1 Tax=Wallemia mellicola (strain ATCC MYA-4683 / CBS 633.66) TaxID=671144 RepID=I4Y9F4_WALMC|nr:hypothetical protein WALSEDRAFT_60877 [Wallemia mellicola CBS 633.66]EIM20596.1 hypothetical protein WALSEDRAFT_60877 [Wallemia mellicola CBS 633.66]|eukprot:XP_006959385.1 hypothetical protein WALSEDRAFT_60877 [Wallemia mellicola CBS 633.66]